jgi:predicted phosphohydrolase
MLFAISDLHFSLGGFKPMDVFHGWEGYVSKIEKNWKRTVSNDDTVVIVGDISWAMRLEESRNDFEFINSLPGKKIIIKGNHDFWWSSIKKNKLFFKNNNFSTIKILQNSSVKVDDVYVCGTRGWKCRNEDKNDIKIVKREVERLKLSLNSAKDQALKRIVFMHFPPVYDGNENSLMEVLVENKISMCYYGHVHGSAVKKAIIGNFRGVDLQFVSCDFLQFCPKLVEV